MFAIKAKKRKSGVKLDFLKKMGEMPAVFYGLDKASTPIAVSTMEFKKVWRQAGESSAVSISLPDEEVDTLIHEVQTDPVTDEPVHVDFLVIDMKKKVTVGVPLEFTGVSEAVKSGLGTLVKVLYEVEIEALPKDLPHDIVVDISSLQTTDSVILVSDLVLPANVAMITKDSEVVASIALQKEEKEEVVEATDLSSIEVEKKGKKDEEGGAESETVEKKEDKQEKKEDK